MTRSLFTGVVAARGVAVGRSYRTDRDHAESLPRRAIGDPVRQITDAFDAVQQRMKRLADSLRLQGQREQAEIMDVAGYLAADADLRAAALGHARDGEPVTVAIMRAVDSYAGMLAALRDPILAERATDVRQVGRRALAWLHGDTGDDQDGPLVLLAHEIGAADLLEPHAPVVAAVSVAGGPNSHAAIVARSLGIPLLLGVDESTLDCPDGTEILVDGARARVIRQPGTHEREAALIAIEAARAHRASLVAGRDLPSQTRDGHPITLRANVATPADAAAGLQAGSDGVGLLRTELPFLDAQAWPGYHQHLAALTPIFRRLTGHPVTVRTLDFADDKLPPFLASGRDGHLGRGLPLMLARPAAFAEQFRAILTAGAATDLRIMIPMVADAAELHACRELLATAAERTGVPAPPIGAMIELPEAVADIERIAAAADFLSIGSNDLTCQILGLDRRDPTATPAMTAHPAVLQAIRTVITTAHDHGRLVSVCGDAAAHEQVIPLLIGLDCDILSVAPAALDTVRARVRGLNRTTCTAIARSALACHNVEQVRQLLNHSTTTAEPA